MLIILAGLIFFMCRSRSRSRGRHEQPQKAEPFAIETSQKYDGHGGSDMESKNARYIASQRSGPVSDGNGSNGVGVGGVGYHSPTPIYGNAFGPTDQHLAYHNQGSACAYPRSEPASDTQERDMMPPTVGPGPSSPNMQQTFQSGGTDPRYSMYSDARAGDYAQGQGARNSTMDVRDIAKEVAELLLPRLRANDAGSPPPPSSTANGGQTGNDLNLRNSHAQYASSVFSTPETDRMKSPAPPEYS